MAAELPERLAALSPAQREELRRRLRERRDGPEPALVPLPASADGGFQLSYAQERYWLLEALSPGDPAHHIPSVTRLRGQLDVEALRAALDAVVARHEVLRTAFVLHGDRPVQVVRPAVRLDVPVPDLAGLSPAARERERRRLLDETALAPFDLASPPLLRARLVRLAADEHELHIAFHHIAGDGLSTQVLAREFLAHYAARANGVAAALPPLPVQVKDHAAWQRARLAGEARERELGFWRQALAGLPELSLPTDRPRTAARASRAARVSLELGPEVARAVRELARSEQATPFMVGLAAFALFLQRSSGETDLAVGVPVTGRERAELRELFGPFFNPVVLRLDAAGDPSFRELLARVRATTLAARRHHDVPFELVVEAVAPARRLDAHPLFQVLFNWVDYVAPQAELPGLRLEFEEALAGALLDVVLWVFAQGDSLRLLLEYDAALFEAATARRFLGRLECALKSALAQPDAPIGALQVLPREELELLARLSAGPPAEPRAALGLWERLDASARRAPSSVAVRAPDASLSYTRLVARAAQLAALLARAGVRPGERVGVLLTRTSDLISGLMAVARLGAAWVPLDPRHPPARLAGVLADAPVRCVLTDAALRPLAERSGGRPLQVEEAVDEAAPSAPVRVAAEAPLYVVHTSGSTGRPKGVVVPHGAAMNLLAAMERAPGIAAGDTLLALTTPSFDIAFLELFGPLVAGGRVRLASEEVAQDGALLARALAEDDVTLAQATPATWRLLLDAGWRGAPRLRVLCGGEALSRALAERLLAGCREVWNLYGPTEATVWATLERVASDPLGPDVVPIGRPIHGLSARVLDEALRPVPLGAPGELCLGGAGLALGYHGLEALTAERFPVDPAAASDASSANSAAGAQPRLYRTGDRARLGADGRLHFLGRLDRQVKLRGHRIELEEIEAHLGAHPGLRAAAVVAETAGGETTRLVAHVVPRAEPLDVELLRRDLRARLPEAMVPALFVAHAALPLTPAGKLDRRALAAGAAPAAAPPSRPGRPPVSATEARLAALAAEVLGLPAVPLDADLFGLGASSLDAGRLVARARAAFDVELPLRRLFAQPSVAALAAAVDAARESGARAGAPPSSLGAPLSSAAAEPGPHPLSFAQERLLFLERFAPASPTYHVAGLLALRGTLDRGALRAALDAVLAQHTALRTAFEERDGRAVQRVLPPGPFPLEEGAPCSRATALARADETARRPFALQAAAPQAGAPLVRALLQPLAGPDGEQLLVFVVHHLVADGLSLAVLVADFARAYRAARLGLPVELPPVGLSYAAFAAWQRARFSGARLEEELGFWRAELAGTPRVLDLPTDRPRPAVRAQRGAEVPVALSATLSDELRRLARRKGTTLFCVLLAGFEALLQRWTGAERFLVGTSEANRGHPELERLVGLCVNTLVLRADVAARPTFTELVRRVHGTVARALEHAELPFEKLVAELEPERDPSRTPLVQVFFDLQRLPFAALDLPDLVLERLPLHTGTAKFDLVLSLDDSAEAIRGAFELDTALFEPRSIADLAARFTLLLEAAARAPWMPLERLPWTFPGEAERLAALGRGPERSLPAHTVLADVLARAAEAPDAPAVADPGMALDRAGLVRAAEVVAAELAARGVGRGDLVGLSLPPSAALAAAALGAWLRGAAYLPLDPAHPPARRRDLLRRAGVRAVVVQESAAEELPALGVEGFVIGRASRLQGPDSVPARGAPQLSDLAYVVVTSGSTGEPKAVEVEHASLANLAAWHRRTYALSAADRVSLLASPAFDASVWELWPALAAGASVRVPDAATRAALPELLAWLARERVSLAFLPTAWVEAARELDWPASPELRAVLTGGDRLRRGPEERWSFQLVNHYGPSEACVVATAEPLTPADARDVPAIGRPIDNFEALVLDASGCLAPGGVPGELALAGSGLARGYRGRPDLTAERFVPHPLRPGARVYLTGDRVRLLADGRLVFLGRDDDQVQVRGVRVEPREVEVALEEHPDVVEARVLARAEPETRLVAYVRLAADATGVTGATGPTRAATDAEGLRAFLRERLPAALVPAAFVVLERFPVTPSGKLDRAALPDPAPAARADAVPPRDELERRLASIWTAVLGVREIGVHDDFFAFGGDSILSLQVVARATRAGLRFSTRDVFEHPTIAGLTRVARSAAPEAVDAPLVGPVPLAPIQRWFFAQRFAEQHHWNQALAFRLRPDADPELLERALALLVAHHDALRTRFAPLPDGATAEILTRAPVALERVDLGAGSAAERGRALERAAQAAQAGLDLARGPTMRVLFARDGAEPPLLVWIVHHLLVDAVSWRTLVLDLEACYADLAAGRDAHLPPRGISLRDWVGGLERLARDAYAPHEPCASWSFPVDDPAAENDEGTARELRLELDEELARGLRVELPRASRARPEDALLAALGLALGELAGAERVVVERESHGRTPFAPELDPARLVGWLTAIHPLELAAAPGTPPRAALAHAKQALRGAPLGGLAHGALPWLRAPAPPGTRSAVLFADQGRLDAGLGADALVRLDLAATARLGPSRSPRARRPWELEVEASAEGARVAVTFRYGGRRLRAATVERLSAAFRRHLAALVSEVRAAGASDLGATPADFPLATLDQAALERLLARYPDAEDLLPLTSTQAGMLFHGLVAPGSAAYFEELASVLRGPLDAAALRRAFENAVERHDLFRVALAWRGLEEPLQVVQRSARLPWTELDWTSVAEADLDARVEEFLAAERARGFDLETAPLLRVHLARLGPARHALLVSYHHAILDGWSLPLVLRGVLDAYGALCRGEPPPRERSAPFRDFLAWLKGRDAAAARAFWRERLRGFEERTPVGPHPPPAGSPLRDRAYGEAELALPPVLTARLAAFAREQGVTPSTLVQAAWALWLARTSGADEVLFGATVAGRPPELDGIEQRVGLFIHTLPVRVRASGDERVSAWLRRMQRRHAETTPYETTPLLEIQRESELPAGEPLFDSLVVFENYPLDRALEQAAWGLEVERTRAFERTSYPLTLIAIPGARLVLRALHDRAFLDEAQAARMLAQLAHVLAELAQGGARTLAEVEVVRPAERARLVQEWSGLGRAVTQPAELVTERFTAQAERAPAAVAIEAGARAWTYAELARASAGIAARLAQRGCDAERVVGLCSLRTPEAIAGMLGVLRAGGAWLPLDPTHPRPRLEAMLAEAQCALVLADEAGRAALEGLEVEVLPLAAEGDPAGELGAPRPEDAAYMLFTSGSSGRPKGVVVEHRSLAHYARAARAAFALSATDRVLQFASFTFDTSVEEIFATFAAGATLVLREDAWLSSLEAFTRAVAERRITVLDLPTAFWHELVAWLDEERARALAGVRLVILGGEAARADVVLRWRAVVGGRIRLLNTYGPTEATVVATLADLSSAALAPGAPVPIGQPIEGALAFVLDGGGRLVPEGAAGELWLGGAGLARGYALRAEETAARFRTVELPGAGALRLYRTGDRVRFADDGQLLFLGRADRQVKLRGQRVEPAEVEAELLLLPGVREAAVVARAAPDGTLHLEAHVVPLVPGRLDAAELRRGLRARLPEFLVPPRFVVHDALPRTSSGKLDRRALNAPPPPVAPAAEVRTPDEALVAQLFAAALGVATAGAHDDFFELGGNSLVAIRLMTRVQEEFGVELPLRELFAGPTPAELTRTIAALAVGAPLAELRRERAPDFAREAALAPEIRPAQDMVPAAAPPRRVFLTGATGFLGAFVLHELLARTAAEVRCLVRAPDAERGRARLRAALERNGQWRAEFAERVVPVLGSLAAERFGLTVPRWEELAAEVEHVLHSGAETSFFRPYAALRAANVGGTREALRLACAGRPKVLHHVSTIGVLSGAGPFDEETPAERIPLPPGGYAQSKWVAEALVREAARRGLVAHVHRPGRIVGDSVRGRWNQADFASRFFTGAARLGALPDLDVAFDLTPVDYVARAIVHVAVHAPFPGACHHLLQPRPLRPRALVAALHDQGLELELVPYAAWRARAAAVAGGDPSHPLHALLPLLPEPDEASLHDLSGPAVSAERTRLALAAAGIVCPPIEGELLARYVAAFRAALAAALTA